MIDAESIRRLAATFAVANTASRVEILVLLAEGDLHVTTLAEALGYGTLSTVSHRLTFLRNSGLVEAVRDRRAVLYRLTESGRAVLRVVALADRLWR